MTENQQNIPEKPVQHWWKKDLKTGLPWGASFFLLLGILTQSIGRLLFGPVPSIGTVSWYFFSMALMFGVLSATCRLSDGSRPPKKPAHENNTPLMLSLGLVLTSIIVKIVGGFFFGSSYWLGFAFGYLLILAGCFFIYWFVTHFMVSLDSTPTKRLNNMAFFNAFLVLYLLAIPLALLLKNVHDPSIIPENAGISLINSFSFLIGVWLFSNFIELNPKPADGKNVTPQKAESPNHPECTP